MQYVAHYHQLRNGVTLEVTVGNLRSVHTRRQVAATCRGDTLQRQIASCVPENFCENLCLRNRILSLQQVAKNQIRLNLCDLLRRQILLQRQRFSQKFSSTHEAICRVAATSCCNLSPSVPTFKIETFSGRRQLQLDVT